MDAKLKFKQTGRVITVTINNPPANFLTGGIMVELNDFLVSLKKRKDVGAVIIESEVDEIFLTHFSVDEIEAAVAAVPFPLPPTLVKFLLKSESFLNKIPGARKLLRRSPMGGLVDSNLFHEVTEKMRNSDKAFIAAINGRAMGGGCELALSCDFRIMAAGEVADGMLIGQPEILIGLLPGGGGTQLLARSVGASKALEHCLEGQPISPQEALELGMINKVVPADQLKDEAMLLAERLSRRSSFSVGAIKRAIYTGATLPARSGMQIEKELFISAASQRNTKAAMRYYIPLVKSILADEQKISIENFAELIHGSAVDMSQRS